MREDIKTAMDRLVDEVIEENDMDFNGLALLKAVVQECASRAVLGLLTVNGTKIQCVTGVVTNDGARIVNLYTEVYSDNENGLCGFGYAYNIDAPDLSEFGYLWTPPVHRKPLH